MERCSKAFHDPYSREAGGDPPRATSWRSLDRIARPWHGLPMDAEGNRRQVYGHGHHSAIVFQYARRSVADSAEYLVPYLETGMTLLDLGCGPGSITIDIARRIAPGTVTGVDAEPTVIETATAAASEAGVRNVSFRVADAYRLPFEDDHFDAGHAHQVLQHLTDPVAALRELRRVVRSGGVIAVRDADYETMVHSPNFDGIHAWKALYCNVADELGAQPRAGRMLSQWAREAGLATIVASASTWTYSTASERHAWCEAWVDRLLHAKLNTLSRDLGLATQSELEAMADDWRAWAAHPAGFFAFLHGEVVAKVPD